MNAATSAKSRALNTLEGVALTAVLECLPIFVVLNMLLKLTVGGPDRAALSTVLVSLAIGLAARWLGPGYPFYMPSFFDASLSLTAKIAAWCERAGTAYRLLTFVLMLSLLGLWVLSR
ncbi:hypothetical protein [Bradyrhizobium sp.]|uniref:hypothetical protein n=1 Tax=Bradyrhizobium sp. TaxID=376 RepID=UPI001D88BCF4|nr:hypothetical protein [Bradyrhizobium sp.]MBV8700830.1 hypothetical protein [Bradyrhizobium sp.]MBV8919741.1 hypothetical protein [Bradyrhizobium sp.]MBV9979366.1 hypothetical protein [Bradyrhizobium sp.]